VWAAAGDLPPGRALADGDLQVVRVRLGAGTAAYLSAVSAPPAGSVLLRPLTSGELVPVSAVGPASTWTRRPVSVPVAGQVPEGVRVGARVDLWSSARDTAAGPAGSSTYRPPVRLAAAAEVFSVAAPGRGLGAVQGSAVQVLLGEQELPAALDALANGARLTLVPAP
jgi:hypothetical protein